MLVQTTDTYSELFQKSKMVFLAKIVKAKCRLLFVEKALSGF